MISRIVLFFTVLIVLSVVYNYAYAQSCDDPGNIGYGDPNCVDVEAPLDEGLAVLLILGVLCGIEKVKLNTSF